MTTPTPDGSPSGSAPAHSPSDQRNGADDSADGAAVGNESISDAIWTIPNAISALRILLIVVFVVLLGNHQDGWAIAALAIAGISDFLDGYLARRWNQVTKLGRLLDPAADRILTVAVVLALAVRGIVPWWLVVLILLRDLVVGVALAIGKRGGVSTPQVTFIGKLATLLLYFALPIAYLCYDRWDQLYVLALVFTFGATVLYWWAGIGYVLDVRRRSRETPVPQR
ncbi:CDP-alcohol phosphatidyltransferase family protein [Demequina aurantiaca]|uniref:CDP-alcohol phosphatidyltransferase family protein n=1 Tax=Demequina aurantiaca TaxID=676200 RepID=UPI003D331188